MKRGIHHGFHRFSGSGFPQLLYPRMGWSTACSAWYGNYHCTLHLPAGKEGEARDTENNRNFGILRILHLVDDTLNLTNLSCECARG